MSPKLKLPQVVATGGALLVGLFLLTATHTAQAHEGGFGNEVMWQACEAKKINDPCAFENLDHDAYRGTCQSMSNALVCVRNQPIEYAPGSPHALEQAQKNQSALSNVANGWPWAVGSLVLLMGGLVVFKTRRSRGGAA